MFKELNTLKIFFESSTKEFNVREVARILKINPATASTQLKNFAKKEILIERKDRTFIFYRSNLENEMYLDLKKFYNVRKIKESGLIEELNKFYIKPVIVIFGSASYGLDVENSDIDLLVVSEKTGEFKEIQKYKKKLNREIQLFVVKKVQDLKNNHLINNVLNGIILQGELKWI
jgi:predicted nucleotidyltransferase